MSGVSAGTGIIAAMSLELAVVVPTFNERENVGELLTRLETALAGVAYEVVFVDDDSPDGTADAIRAIALGDPRVRIVQRIGRRGLSSACIEGILATPAPYVAVMDADLQHDESLLPAMLGKLRGESLDLVVATRYIEGGSDSAFSENRARLSHYGRTVSRIVTRSELSDPMSGFFMIDRRFFSEVAHALSAVGFKILLDIVSASRRPVRFAELPYHFRPRLHGASKLDLSVGLEYLQLVIHKLTRDVVPPRFVLFALVGGTGVVLHLAILYALILAHQPFVRAQIVSTIVVMTTNFFLNNALTWRDHRLRGAAMLGGLLEFYLACAVGAFVNVQIASYALKHGVPWYIAGFAGLTVGSVWNFAVTAATTWNRRRRPRATPAS